METSEEILCIAEYRNASEKGVKRCPVAWDGMTCWPPTSAGQTAVRLCLQLDYAKKHLSHVLQEPQAKQDHYLLEAGHLTYMTLVVECTIYALAVGVSFWAMDRNDSLPYVVACIMFVGSCISLLALSLTAFIFFHFKSLQCSRLRVHRNLVSALALHSLLLLLLAAPRVVTTGPLQNTGAADWLCKIVLVLKLYASLTTVNWMFVEGLLLHTRIAVAVFRQEAPFKLYYVIGWGLPFVVLGVWTYLTWIYNKEFCWKGYGQSPYIWLITGPMIAFLTVNAVFLVNIIRILFSKLQGNSSVEITQVSKAAKATALLFPLLGIPHLLFCINPGEDSSLQSIYLVANALLQSSQGLFVSVLYCFMNTEVQTVLRNAYLRAVLRRNPNSQLQFHTRSQRSRGLSRTSTTFLSTCEHRAGRVVPDMPTDII